MCLPGRGTREWQVIECDSGGLVIVGGASNDVTDFMDKRDPVIQSVGEGSRVQVGAAQMVAMLGVSVVGTIGGVGGVQNPTGKDLQLNLSKTLA